MNEVAAAVALAIINSKLIDALKAPIQKKHPNLDLWWVIYVAFVTGLGLGWVSGINIMTSLIPDPVVGRIVTGLFIGGGASLIYDVFTDRGTELVVEMEDVHEVGVTAETGPAHHNEAVR